MTVAQRVLCRGHPRCTAPMAEAASAYHGVRPAVLATGAAAHPVALFDGPPAGEVDTGRDLEFAGHPMVRAAGGSTAPADEHRRGAGPARPEVWR